MIKVILCDDHAMVRRGIRDTLCEAVDIQVTGEAGPVPDKHVHPGEPRLMRLALRVSL